MCSDMVVQLQGTNHPDAFPRLIQRLMKLGLSNWPKQVQPHLRLENLHMDVGVHSYVWLSCTLWMVQEHMYFSVCWFFSKSICFVSVDIRLVVKLVIRGLDHCINRQSSRESIIVLLLDNWYFCSCTFLYLYICSHFYCVLCSFLFIIHITKSQLQKNVSLIPCLL